MSYFLVSSLPSILILASLSLQANAQDLQVTDHAYVIDKYSVKACVDNTSDSELLCALQGKVAIEKDVSEVTLTAHESCKEGGWCGSGDLPLRAVFASIVIGLLLFLTIMRRLQFKLQLGYGRHPAFG